MRLAWRNLLQDRIRAALSVSGVALAVMLVLLLGGLRSGLYRQMGLYLGHTPGSIVVAQDGVENLLAATSLLPAGTEAAVRQADGVGRVIPILTQFVILDIHDKKQPAYLVGYEAERGGGPWSLVSGREPTADTEAVFDRVLARRHDLGIGDEFVLQGRTLTLVGLSAGTSSLLADFVFVRKSAAEALLATPNGASFLLVTPASEASEAALKQRLGALPGADVLAKRTLIANDRAFLGKVLNAPIVLMVGIAFLVGTLVVGLVIYTATAERRREYGVLRAIGAEARTLYVVVLCQALLAMVAGVLLGVALAFGAGAVIAATRPQLAVSIETPEVARALLAAFAIALIAALAPARIIAGLQPAEAFRR